MGKDIKQIETELQQLLQADKANWIRIYELMEEVDRENLWKGIERSFTAWVRGLAGKIGIHESLLWSRKKAGGIYAEYAQRAKARGEKPAAMAELNISPDSLVFCEKIARGNDQIKDELIAKTISGELKRADLKQAWASRRAELENKGVKAVKSNSRDELVPEPVQEQNPGTNGAQDTQGTEKSASITAADVVFALRNADWLKPLLKDVKESPYKKMVYRTIPEFPVRTGTSHHARRIDLLIIENYSVKPDDLVLFHGVEIKVSKSDLLNDHKSSEYAPYVEVMWFAVPEHLVEYAKTVADVGWGILSIDKNKKVSVAQKADPHEASLRDKTLNTALIKLL